MCTLIHLRRSLDWTFNLYFSFANSFFPSLALTMASRCCHFVLQIHIFHLAVICSFMLTVFKILAWLVCVIFYLFVCLVHLLCTCCAFFILSLFCYVLFAFSFTLCFIFHRIRYFFLYICVFVISLHHHHHHHHRFLIHLAFNIFYCPPRCIIIINFQFPLRLNNK